MEGDEVFANRLKVLRFLFIDIEILGSTRGEIGGEEQEVIETGIELKLFWINAFDIGGYLGSSLEFTENRS